MRILVTGARGFVGSALLPVLAAEGHTGIATGRESPVNLPPGWAGLRREDVLIRRQAEDMVDAIVHLEVKQHVARPSPAAAAEFECVNVTGTRQWLDWATANGLSRFLHFSSIKAASGGPGIHLEAGPVRPDTAYGRSKAAAEQAVRAWSDAARDRAATILRPAPIYGPGNEANMAAFVQRVLVGRRCLVGDGGARKSLVGRRNLIAAVCFLLGRNEPGCEIFNVSDLELVTIRELACLIAEVGSGPAPRGIPQLVANLLAPVGDMVGMLTGQDFPLTTTRLRSITSDSIFPCDKLVAAGFRHPWSLRQGITEMIDWAKTRYCDH